ncbi:uncharacterized protein Z520_11636 [Fonsecaea multimorphosa CBS 102226]|uniref:Uncharacterized protein n=1 Tax=Fonsecaea multimorphosa CBS 102226 TaxID=1442371 RepID=A0A0D2JHE1_9EURO|nr:uncharacterized protein Z520_11636 [Fonsecaea multimorphosa CBS 102226]KIX92607.1 hypothetical protein Z520_11636 [Fonsecaea multimorphosa CBS 102226]OAL17911.1 hypothetical protein AYO22_11175 [Fonsecaea multimorphosa]
MTRGLSAASCISSQTPRFVWISDVLVTDTFNRFCHHKRYGSSVPGPLEAQRRAARRKNTSLAYTSSGGISADPSIVLGSSANKLAWWQSFQRAEAADSASPRVLPSWIFPFESSVAQAKPTSVAIETERASLEPRSALESETLRLSQCKTLIEVKGWIQDEGVDLRENAHVRAAIPRHILQMDFPIHEIASYIGDPIFHPSGTSSILQLVRGLLGRTWDATSWGTLHDALCSATELGLLSVNDLKEVIAELVGLTEVQLTDARGQKKRVKANAQMYLVSGMLESLDRSTVMQIADLGSPFLAGLFSKFATLKWYRGWCQKLLWRLLPWALKSHVHVIRRITLKQLEDSCSNNSPEEVGRMLAERLSVVNPEVLQLALTDITEKLLDISMLSGRRLYRYLWHHWCGTLAVLGSPGFDVSLTQNGWISAQSTESCLRQDQRLLAFAWTAMYLSQGSRKSMNVEERLQFLRRFEELLRSIPEFSEDFLDRAVIDLDYTNLPNKYILLRNLMRLSTRAEALLAALDAKSDPQSTLKPGISPSLFDKHTQHAHLEGNEALAKLIKSSNYDLSAFKILSRRMIQKSTASFGFICHLLETSPHFKLALRTPHLFSPRPAAPAQKSARQNPTAMFANPGAPTEVETVTSSGPERLSRSKASLPSRDEVIDLIGYLALSFATSPVATPRAALRRVYWCYRFLRYYGAPVPPAVTRALWHVGVARHGDKGTPATLLKWIVSQVEHVEGEDVAKQLLWKETFRQARQEQVTSWAKVDEDAEKRLTAELEAMAIHDDGEGDNHFPGVEQPADPDPDPNPDLLKKIMFIKSEPPDMPVWTPKPRAQRRANPHHDESSMVDSEEGQQDQEVLQRREREALKITNRMYRG